jgi:Tol biopolymer transport system component
MTPERWQHIRTVFQAAAEREPSERAAFLDEACADDIEMRLEVESLLSYDGSTGGALESEHDPETWLAVERERVLREACGDNDQLRQRIDDVLDRPDQGTAGQPAIEVAVRSEGGRLTPGDLLGPYRVVELLGTGGMGEVYKATDTRLGRTVALKLLTASTLSASHAQRFVREARAASALNHPNICTLYDIGEYRGEPLLVMELLEGQTLDARIAGKPLPIDQLLNLALQIAAGLEAAHTAGLVHRDIKPANIYVTSQGQVKILDFGLAKSAGPSGSEDWARASGDPRVPDPLTRPGSNPGTPGYMSPEQARGEKLDGRSDLFSLGLVLVEMATGKSPFAEQPASGLLAAVSNDEPVSLVGVDRQVAPGLARVIRKALAKDRRHRHQAAGELLNDLRSIARTRARRPAYAAVFVLGMAAVTSIAAFTLRSRPAPAPARGDWIQITNFSDSVVEPSLSPDGEMLTFIRGPRTFTTMGQVYVMRLPDGDPRPLTDDDRMKMSPVFSPDGSSIAYTRIEANWAWDTWRVPVSGGPAAPFAANASGLSWTARGERLFSEIKTGLHMAIVTSDDGRAHGRDVYVPLQQNGMAHRSHLSPDRRSVLVAEMNSLSGWLPCRLVPFDGSSRGREVGPPDASCTSAAWSPDGRWMYFSANAGGAFHLWRQEFPNGTPYQITSGPAEEEGIAIAPDGRSLITSVGTGISTIWLRDSNGEQRLSEQGHSFRPRFSNDGETVFYLASQRPGAFQALIGELWSFNRASGQRQRLALSDAIVAYTVDTDRNEVLFSTMGGKGQTPLWRAALDGRTPPRKLADSVGLNFPIIQEDIFFAAPEEASTYVYTMRVDGGRRRKALPHPVAGFQAVSPDRKWLIVRDRTPIGAELGPIVLYPFGGDTNSRIPLCGVCFASWVLGGRYLTVRFSGSSDAEQRTTYLVPIPPGELLPAVFRQGRLISEAEVAAAPGVRAIPRGDLTFGTDPDTYVYPQLTSHRNLFRIPLE